MGFEFLKIPNNVITNAKYKNKLLSIIVYLSCSENKLNLCKFTFLEFIEFGLWNKPKYGKDGVMSEGKEFIKYLVEDGYLSVNEKLEKITLSTNIVGNLNLRYEINDSGQPIKWFRLRIENYKKILNLKCKLDKNKMLNLYCYILSKIMRRNDKIDNISITGGSAEIFWCSQENICDDLNITKPTLNTYLGKLNELGLIYYGSIGAFQKDGYIIKPHNVYAENEEELKEGLKQSKYYWENEGWKLLGK